MFALSQVIKIKLGHKNVQQNSNSYNLKGIWMSDCRITP